jgi:hypothetical protein
MFHMDVAKVERDVEYVAMVVHICCKRLFLMFHLFFRCMLQECLSILYIFHTYVVNILSGCCV